MFTKRSLIAAAAAAVLSLPAAGAAFAQDLEEVKIALGWLRNGQYAALMAADAEGYFKEEGIAIELLDGGPGKNPISIVGVGQADFGIVFGTSVFRARLASTPIDITAVGALIQGGPYAYIRLADKGAPEPTPKDMEGKRIGIQSDGEAFLKAFAKENDVDYDSLQIQIVQGGAEPLLTGQIDYFSGWVTNQTFQIEMETTQEDAPENIKGKIWQSMLLSDYAVNSYGDVIIAETKTVQERPELVEKVLRAIARGLKLSEEKPEYVAKIVAAYPGQLDSEEKMIWRMTNGVQNGLAKSDATRQKGYLWMEADIWMEYQQFYLDTGEIDRVMDASEFTTNDLNPGVKSD